MTINEYVEEYITTRGLSKSTRDSLRLVLNEYSELQGLSIQELLTEADTEEEKGIRWKRRTLKRRLITYTNYLKSSKNLTTVKLRMRMIKAFYRHHEIEIGMLPPINKKNAKVSPLLTYEDIPSKEIIRQAYDIAEPLMKALLLFLSSSGMSKADALNLTINSFIIATSKFHNNNTINEVIEELKTKENIIPTWKCRRQKTNKFYITFNTDEATREIINYLSIRLKKRELKGDDKLFKIDKDYFTVKFQELNDTLGLSKAGAYNQLRGHMMRKFQASNLEKEGMSRALINTLQGKSNNAVDDVYFYENEETLRNEYIKHQNGILILTEVNTITIESDEVLQMRLENEELKKQLMEISEMKSDLEKLKEIFFS